ncbi:hypothetical protein MTO96_002912 [Rhipicephalus appendiculatus]
MRSAAHTSPVIPQQSRPPDGNDAPQGTSHSSSFDVRASSERVITAALAVFTLVPTKKGQREGGTDIGAARPSAKRAAARTALGPAVPAHAWRRQLRQSPLYVTAESPAERAVKSERWSEESASSVLAARCGESGFRSQTERRRA